MKYFEFNHSNYYALISAETEEQALNTYQEYVADNDEKDGIPDELTEDEARMKYNVACKESDEEPEEFDTFINESLCVLLIDGSLI